MIGLWDLARGQVRHLAGSPIPPTPPSRLMDAPRHTSLSTSLMLGEGSFGAFIRMGSNGLASRLPFPARQPKDTKPETAGCLITSASALAASLDRINHSAALPSATISYSAVCQMRKISVPSQPPFCLLYPHGFAHLFAITPMAELHLPRCDDPA